VSQRFVKGYTNNHLTWVMVDATDFATPESALSAATKIKIYGKVRGGTGVNFVSSGTGSLTNDIQHVGASALGIYTIALAKADLSDASAAWYDQYIISLSATGAAYQALVVDGGMIASYLSAVGSDTLSAAVALSDAVSNVHSELTSQFAVVSNYLSSISAIASDAHSAAILGASHASDAASYALLIQSRLSDYMSAIYPSDISDIRSMLAALSDAISNVDSAVSSQYSDLESKLTSVHSDLKSAVGAVSVVLSASDISDLASAINATNPNSGILSDIYSLLSDTRSTMDSQFLVTSNYLSNLSAILSDVNSAQDSQFAVVSNYLSNASNFQSDILSTMGSQFAVLSDYLSNASNFQSDISSTLGSQFAVISNYLSSISAIASDAHSAAILGASHASTAAAHAAIAASAASNLDSVFAATRAEPAQGSPGATITALAKLDYLYKAWRNRTTQTATEYALYADDGTTKDHEAPVSDDGVTFVRGEVVTGA
jgi:hypothetical protein